MTPDRQPEIKTAQPDLNTSFGTTSAGFKVIFEDKCGGGGDCPTIYEAPNGSIAVQGYRPSAEERAALNIPDGEDIVLLPAEFFKKAINKLG